MEMVYNIQLLAVVIVRVSAFLFQMPVFGGTYIPNTIKIAFGLAISIVIFPLVPNAVIPSSGPFLIDFGFFLFKEMLVGITAGFAISIFINGIRYTGRIIGENMGMTMANVIDPESNENVSIMEQINYFLFLYVFLVLNGHYFLIKALVDSYSLVPIGMYSFHRDIIMSLIDILRYIFITGFTIAMPVFGALMIANVMLAIIAKVAQKVQVLLLSFPLKIMVGVIVTALVMPMIMDGFMLEYEDVKIAMYRIIQAMY